MTIAEELRRIARIEVPEEMAREVRELVARADTSEVSELLLGEYCLESLTWEALCEVAWPKVESIHVSDLDCNPEVAEIIGAADLPALRLLWFRGWMEADFGDEGARVVAASPNLGTIENLALVNCELGPAGARSLAESPNLGPLRDLNLGWGQYTLNLIGAEGARAIAGSAGMSSLETLTLAFNKIGDEGAVALAESDTLRSLEFLCLQACEITDSAFADLSRSPVTDTCRTLDVSHNHIGFAGVDAMCRAELPALRELWLYHNPIGDKAVAALASSPVLSQLTTLNLCNCKLTDVAADALLESSHLPASFEALFVKLNTFSESRMVRLIDRFGPAIK